MSANIWKTGTSNAFNTTLNGGITDNDSSITLASVTGLQYPGVLVIDRVDATNTATPTLREFISFTGIAGNSITGVSRGLGGSNAQAHNSSAKVEETWSVSHWNDFIDTFLVSHSSTGTLLPLSSVTITNAVITNSLNVSGASLIGNFGLHPVWVIGGAVSAATTSVGKPLPTPAGGSWKFFSAVLRTPTSGASCLVDINKNGTTIFSDQNTRLYFPPGGTYVSTASIGVKSFVAGDIFTADLDSGMGSGADLTILGRGQ